MENGNPERKTNWTPPSPPEKKPIVCPVCGNVHLAFVTEYHKALLLRVIRIIVALIPIALFGAEFYSVLIKHEAATFESSFIGFLIFFIVAAVILSCFITAIESTTHVKAICKECGNLWLLD